SQCARPYHHDHRHTGPRDQLQLRRECQPDFDHAELERTTGAPVGWFWLEHAQPAVEFLRRVGDWTKERHGVAGDHASYAQRYLALHLRLQQLAPGLPDQEILRRTATQ